MAISELQRAANPASAGASAIGERRARTLCALKLRICTLEEECDDLGAEIEALSAYLEHLVREAWDRHDRMVELRAVAVRVMQQQQREAA